MILSHFLGLGTGEGCQGANTQSCSARPQMDNEYEYDVLMICTYWNFVKKIKKSENNFIANRNITILNIL